MSNYLIDTNVFYDLLCHFTGNSVPSNTFDLDMILKGKCFISEVTKMEIYSVIGKYARGKQKQKQLCTRCIDEAGKKCTNEFYEKGMKKWETKKIAAWKKLLSDIYGGAYEKFSVEILPVTSEVYEQANRVILHSFKFDFGSLDAVIAGTALYYSDKNLIVVSHDKSLRRAMEVEGMEYLVEETT